MDRYIDADKTLDMMWNALYQYEDDMEKKHGLNLTERLDVQNGFEIAHKVVVGAPTADVVPVVHAHWTRKRMLSHDGELYCSNCEWTPEVLGGTTLGDLQLADVYYCPHCGAIMDEEVE